MTAVLPAERVASGLVGEADFVLAHGGSVLHGRAGDVLDLPPLSEDGPSGIARGVARALAAHPDAVVAGLVPFDPAEPPHLFSLLDGRREPTSTTPGAAPDTAPIPTPDDPFYRQQVSDALTRIDTGGLHKVVLARSMDVCGPADPGDLWSALLARNPHGYVFAVRQRDGASTLVGASPELIARVGADGFATRPLAGSTPRAATPTEDDRRARALLASTKDLREHRYVVDHITDRLGPLVLDLRVPAGPTIFRTDAMLHLGTQLSGHLGPGIGSLEAALAIHPTPAVCGVPTEAALRAIRDLELESRGMYAGLVGWADARGHGLWALALRSAVIGPTRTRLFAGAGVVAGSTPEAEHAETAAKFTTVATALAHATSGALA